jgi:DNA-binding GntR family transcriptional regulator
MTGKLLSEESLKRKVYLSIFGKIVQTKFPVDAILKEGELAAMFGVSRAPVREALIELCNENILRSMPRAGYRIVQLSERDLREAEDLRCILEIEGLRRIRAVDPAALEKLKVCLNEARSIIQGKKNVWVDRWWHNNMLFHMTLNTLAGNRQMTQALEKALNFQWRALAQVFWDTDPVSYLAFESPTHQVILEALRNSDLKTAEKALREDLGAIAKRLSDFSKGEVHDGIYSRGAKIR